MTVTGTVIDWGLYTRRIVYDAWFLTTTISRCFHINKYKEANLNTVSTYRSTLGRIGQSNSWHANQDNWFYA